VNEGPPSIIELVRGAQRQMRVDFEQKTAQIPHAGEKGAAREDVVRGFLKDYLPKRFGVGSGFVVDAAGAVSRQLDAVVYDQLAAPTFPVTDTQRFYPAEAVAGAISIKSSLTSQTLTDVAENLASVAQLDRFASGRPEVVFGGVPAFQHSAFSGAPANPIFAACFAFESTRLETLAVNLDQLNQGLEPPLRVQLIGVLNRGVVTYGLDGVVEPSYSPAARVALVEDSELALPLFYAFLVNAVMLRMPLLISTRTHLGLEVVEARTVEPQAG
jgi:hypothetical protein